MIDWVFGAVGVRLGVKAVDRALQILAADADATRALLAPADPATDPLIHWLLHTAARYELQVSEGSSAW
jgi:hypothetical protein